ncbi:MAG: DUF1861 family protein [Oscillospiraceae bacterium]|nr:DUF1861 family protein [Oscillospiraceae bacterium]
MFKDFTPTRATRDYEDFQKNRFPAQKGEMLKFVGADGLDVYNTSVPFEHGGKRIIAARTEARKTEDSTTMFFEEKGGEYVLMPEAKKLEGLQDPFFATIDGRPILGGVHALWRPDGSLITYHTDFYDIEDLACPTHILHGPDEMKDIRLLQLPDSRIAVFTRPNGRVVSEYGIVAAVGFAIFDSLKEITPGQIAGAPLIKWLFCENEWGGVNQAHNLKNGKIGLVGHKARGEMIGGVHYLHYCGFATAIDLSSGEIAPTKIICARECFPEAEPKRELARDVCFVSGIERLPGGKAFLYSGLSDSREGRLQIEDPFLEHEM